MMTRPIMRKLIVLTWVIGICIWNVAAAIATDAPRPTNASWSQMADDLKSVDEAVRHAAAWKLAVDEPEAQDAELVIKLIETALSSNDPKVVAYGTFAASRIALAAQPRPRRLRGESTPFDFSSNEIIRRALVRGLSDSDRDVQKSSIMALVLTFDPMVNLEPLILKQIASKEADVPRAKFIALLASWNIKSKAAVTAMIESLESSDFHLREVAAWSIGQIRPAQAVEPLVHAYFASPDIVKEDILRALREYKNADPKAMDEIRKAQAEVENLTAALTEAAETSVGPGSDQQDGARGGSQKAEKMGTAEGAGVNREPSKDESRPD